MTDRGIGRRVRGEAGFTLMELLVSSAIMVLITGAIFSMMNPAQGAYKVQPEVSDLQQRLRVGVDTLQKDLVMAGAGTYSGPAAGALSFFIAPIMPYDAFGSPTDPAATATSSSISQMGRHSPYAQPICFASRRDNAGPRPATRTCSRSSSRSHAIRVYRARGGWSACSPTAR